MRHTILGLSALWLVAFHAGPLAAQARTSDPCQITTAERVVAVGDVHGAFEPFVAVLREAGLIDQRNRWIGGRSILVQTGDVLDRGAESRKALDLLRRLERDASRAGGQVHALLGNHEVMRLVGDWRYVSEGEYAAFRTNASEDLRRAALEQAAKADEARAAREGRSWDAETFRNQFLKDVPQGWLEMREAFSPRGDYGKWLRTHVATVRINGVMFMHGGVSPEVAPRGCRGINDAVAADVRVAAPTPRQVADMFSIQPSGPLWFRGLADQPEALPLEDVDAILATLEARAIVIGHTVVKDAHVTPRYDGRVIQIDTGMLGGTWYPGGQPSALEMRGDRFTAIYVGRPKAPLSVPAIERRTAAAGVP